jgi:hypothetical protein
VPRVLEPAKKPPAPPPPIPPPPPPATIKYSTLKLSAGGVHVHDSTVLNETTVYRPSLPTNELVHVVVTIRTAFAGAIASGPKMDKVNGIPDNITKVKRANRTLITLLIRCFS